MKDFQVIFMFDDNDEQLETEQHACNLVKDDAVFINDHPYRVKHKFYRHNEGKLVIVLNDF